jgi:hypothetical protein
MRSRTQAHTALSWLIAMDLFRNLDQQSADLEAQEFDEFAPAWREHVPIDLPQTERRARVMSDGVLGVARWDAARIQCLL